ncbi:MAG: type II secretion system protein [Patescibacteria group bacterium]
MKFFRITSGNNSKQGFTLVEVLVAVSIFSILSVVVSSIFLNVNGLQRNTASYQRLQNEGRYMLEKLAREVRSREISYPLENPQDHLFFKKDEKGNYLRICWVDDWLKYYLDADNSLDNEENLNNCRTKGQPLNAHDVSVTEASFFILPVLEDRWGEKPLSNIQTRATVLLKIKNNSGNSKDQKELTLQTTISSKIYKR